MSLLDSDFSALLDIKLYYIQKSVGTGKKLIILEDKKGEELLKQGKDDVEVLETKWRPLLWQENNEVMEQASGAVNPNTGERQFNFIAYRDAIVKRCIKEWNIKDDESNPIPVSPQNIDKLPASVVTNLYRKFESVIEYSEEDLGN
tara:strand:+ start:4682 stop:5119 length:438 start_codon:yes stop_codon:yes gene_type:complete